VTVTAAVARLWPDGVDAVEPLGGGITNHNFKVTVGDESFVVRIGGADTRLLGIDRRAEHDASSAAAELGIAPEVVAFVEPEGYLVTRFVEGEVGQASVDEVAPLLRRFHSGRSIEGRFDSFEVVEDYARLARERGVSLPAAYEDARETARLIRRRRGAVELRPCHNDLLASNFIAGHRLWIVDWEYAGMGDPAFDLANFAVNNGLDADGDQALLSAYGEEVDEGAHVLFRFMSDFREAMWGVVQHALSELDFDFAAYAAEHFERMERTAAEPRFRSALRA
jgi:thiamine kinase-like enzyme